jgi:tRNA wybutosine-synthesizing protein 1
MIPTELIISLRREKYQLVGRHSAVKKCMWLHKSLTNNESCYKHKFYGVESWRCLQMTPAIAYCTLRCSFCWRVQARDLGLNFNESSIPVHDEPNIIVE